MRHSELTINNDSINNNVASLTRGNYYIITGMAFDIRDRAKRFAIKAIALIRIFPKDVVGHTLGKQLIRSATSIGANLEEADAASSRKDFLHKVSIAYKEARESRYWLEIALESELLNHQKNITEAKALQAEAVELSKILYSIINSKKINN
ncbi:MAG: four helix bundle protein [Candidatus Margulisiibacteriota bacterium]